MSRTLTVDELAAPPGFEGSDYIRARRGVLSWLTTVDHKRIGLMYLASVLVAFALGGLFEDTGRLEDALAVREAALRVEPGSAGLQNDVAWTLALLVRVSVRDFGAGIPAEVLPRIFDPFFTTKGRDQGTGLGLAVSHGIAQEHSGELTVETVRGQGTCFILELPTSPDHPLDYDGS